MSEPSREATYEAVLEANRKLSAQLADSYNESEPHYRPENVAKVKARLQSVVDATEAKSLLDLGCGSGFIIDIARPMVERIHGIDASAEMIERVDTAGPAEVTVEVADTGEADVEEGAFDVATAYSFLHHLYEVEPTLRTAATALRPGGRLYVDLEPNKEFWDLIASLDREAGYDPIVARELAMVADHEGAALAAGVDPETFDLAEWGKTTQGGLAEADLRAKLEAAGFPEVEFFYEWFIGQGQMINEEGVPKDEALANAAVVDGLLKRALPLSRGLFKYMGFVATRR